MKRIILLILNTLLCILACEAQYLKRESTFYPCLDIIISNYYNCYFRYPDKIKKLVRFAEYFLEAYPDVNNSCRDNLSMEILPYLKKNMKHILIEEDEGNTYTIRISNDTLLYISSSFWPFSPCEDSLFKEGSPIEYYHYYDNLRIPRFYSSHNDVILYPDSVYQGFKREVSEIQRKYIVISNSSLPYKYYIYKNDTVPILSMLEYNFGKPLRYYCNGDVIRSSLPFYRKLESYLRRFCKLHKCKRMLFMFPDYNLSDYCFFGYGHLIEEMGVLGEQETPPPPSIPVFDSNDKVIGYDTVEYKKMVDEIETSVLFEYRTVESYDIYKIGKQIIYKL